jgi:hypothetical protein
MNKSTPEYPRIDLKPFEIPQHWSPEQALAVFEFLEQLLSLLWDQYQQPLIQLLQPELDPDTSNQLDLFDFNDEIPF